MNADISSNISLYQEFKNSGQFKVLKEKKLDMRVKVLAASHWPDLNEGSKTPVPNELLFARDIFTKFYQTKHGEDRKLEWTMSQGTAAILYQIKYKGKIKKYKIKCSNLQLAVILTLMRQKRMTVKELEDELNISSVQLYSILYHFVHKIPLLKRADKSKMKPRPQKPNFGEDEEIFFNPKFQSKAKQFNVH